VLVLHLSNRYLDLEPVVGRLVRASGAAGLIRANTDRNPELERSGDPSIWAAIASDRSHLAALQNNPKWRPLRIRESVGLWTDDFSNIFSVFIWSVPRLPEVKPQEKMGAPDDAGPHGEIGDSRRTEQRNRAR
jgi:hypothetical protein